MTYVERLNVLHSLFPVPVVTLVWLQEFFNEVVIIHKHIYCLQLTRVNTAKITLIIKKETEKGDYD